VSRRVRQSGGFPSALTLRLAAGVMSASACASQSQQCVPESHVHCSPAGSVSLGCQCGTYWGTEICGNDPSYALCSGACSGGTNCDPGFVATAVDSTSNQYADCRPGPFGLSNTICCPSDAEVATANPCFNSSDCGGGLVCCLASTPSGGACGAYCGSSSRVCLSPSDCTDGEVCNNASNPFGVRTCRSASLPCKSTGDCAMGRECCFDFETTSSNCETACEALNLPRACAQTSECTDGRSCQPVDTARFGDLKVCSPDDAGTGDGASSDAKLPSAPTTDAAVP